MKTGLVTFLDVLGFSNYILDRESFSENYDKYVHIIKNATESAALDYVLFSDSIIITSEEISEEGILNMLTAVSEISFSLLKLGVALCGCISYGSFEKQSDPQNSIITGKPIVEAINYEKKQNWVGVMLAPSLIKSQPLIKECLYPGSPENTQPRFLRWASLLSEYECIPFPEPEPFYHGFVVIPHRKISNTLQKVLNDLQEYNAKLEEIKLYAPGSYEQKKYQKSRDFINKVRNKFGLTLKERDIKW